MERQIGSLEPRQARRPDRRHHERGAADADVRPDLAPGLRDARRRRADDDRQRQGADARPQGADARRRRRAEGRARAGPRRSGRRSSRRSCQAPRRAWRAVARGCARPDRHAPAHRTAADRPGPRRRVLRPGDGATSSEFVERVLERRRRGGLRAGDVRRRAASAAEVRLPAGRSIRTSWRLAGVARRRSKWTASRCATRRSGPADEAASSIAGQRRRSAGPRDRRGRRQIQPGWTSAP